MTYIQADLIRICDGESEHSGPKGPEKPGWVIREGSSIVAFAGEALNLMA
jgi:hypothetical protein